MPRATCSTLALVASHRFEIGVDERDLHREKSVGGVLDDLSALGGGHQERGWFGDVAEAGNGVALLVVGAGGERKIDPREDGCGAFAVGADDDAVGMKEVGDGGSFAKELRVGDDIEEVTGDAVALHGASDPLIGVDGHCAFFDDDLVTGDGTGYLAGDGFDVGEICVAGFTLRGSDRDEDGFALASSLGEVGHEADVGVTMLLQKLGEVVLMN